VLRCVPRWSELRVTLASVERWLLPGECLLCHGAVESGPRDPLICAACRSRWSRLPEPQCPRCGQPLTRGIACRICVSWPVQLRGVHSAVWLDEAARRAVHLLKYAGWWRVAEAMAGVMASCFERSSGTALLAIPLGRTRLRRRGYNQSAVLAEALGERLRLPVAGSALQRRRETTTQTALTPEARRANLAGAFVAAGEAPKHAVLVDDVFTTGATIVEAAAALLAAGTQTVSGITFARAARPLAGAQASPDPGQSSWSRP
jgi:ComF family protein